ncbi:MAG: N-acetyltransferase family protein [Candidatus Tectimicrobiota bacterium]
MGWLYTQKTLCLFEVELKGTPAPACTARVEAEYQVLDAATWATQRHTEHLPDRQLFPARFARGEQFWTAQCEQRIVSYCWVTSEPVEIGEIRCVMSSRVDEVYIYDAFTFPEYRGNNLYPVLLQRVLEYSRQQGRRRALIFVLSDNAASIRGVQKAGFQEFQRVTYRNVLGFVRYSYRPLLSTTAGVDLLHA